MVNLVPIDELVEVSILNKSKNRTFLEGGFG